MRKNDHSKGVLESGSFPSSSKMPININTAEKILLNSGDDNLSFLKDWLRNCYSENFLEINKKMEWFNNLSKMSKRAFLHYSLKLMREALVSKIETSLVKVSAEEEKFINNFKKTLDKDSLADIILLFDKSISNLDGNANPKILFLNLSIKLSNFFQTIKT